MYGIYLPTLVVSLLATVLATLASLAPVGPGRGTVASALALALAAAGVLGALCLTVAGAAPPGSGDFFDSWHNGDAPMEQVVNAMRAHHITDCLRRLLDRV